MKWPLIKQLGLVIFGFLMALPASVSAQSEMTAFQKNLADLIQSKGRAADSVRLHQLLDLFWKYNMEENPEWATYIGYPGLNDKWGDRSFAAIERRKKENLSIMEAVNSISKEKLSES